VVADILMVQGTMSNSGKSTVAAGLCRILKRSGLSVAPFKPQNMSLNAAVTGDGGEIGRAQAVQAHACGIEPHSDMNPILLKPQGGSMAQLIVQGEVAGTMSAREFHAYKPEAMQFVLQSFERLRSKYDAVIVEGAGSPAEINLRDGDIANMGFAEAVDCPVVLVGDIDRGGVFAQLAGTLALLAPSEHERIRSLIINKFRGDVSLLTSGIDWLAEKTCKPIAGVIPYIERFVMEPEDSLSLTRSTVSSQDASLHIVALITPSLSNHSDLSALAAHPQVTLTLLRPGQPIPPCDLIILGGSKSTIGDLNVVKQQGWDQQIKRHLRYGGKLIGICGGFQMLGSEITDPNGLESASSTCAGLNLFEMSTQLLPNKILDRKIGVLTVSNSKCSGYEIHMGRSDGVALDRPAIVGDGFKDGAISEDNCVLGTYFHGLFDEDEAMSALLRWAGLSEPLKYDYRSMIESNVDRLADTMIASLDLSHVWIHEAPLQPDRSSVLYSLN